MLQHSAVTHRQSLIVCTVQIICDAIHVITNVVAKWPGSDLRIFGESKVSTRLRNGKKVLKISAFCLFWLSKNIHWFAGDFLGHVLGDGICLVSVSA